MQCREFRLCILLVVCIPALRVRSVSHVYYGMDERHFLFWVVVLPYCTESTKLVSYGRTYIAYIGVFFVDLLFISVSLREFVQFNLAFA